MTLEKLTRVARKCWFRAYGSKQFLACDNILGAVLECESVDEARQRIQKLQESASEEDALIYSRMLEKCQ